MRKLSLIIGLFLSCSLAFAQEQKVSLLFAGDAMQHKSQIDVANTADGYDYSTYFRNVAEQIHAADISVINLEVTLGGKPYKGYPNFCAPDEYAVAIKDAGFNVFVTANNHSADTFSKGIERTIDQLNLLDIIHTGTFKNAEEREMHYPLLLEKNGILIAMLNYTYGTNGITVEKPNIVNMINKAQIKEDIERAQSMGADIIVANMHWGIEYVLKQNKVQEDLANFLIDNGVRLVIGSHPHVVQPMDIRKKDDKIESVVVYSLGNYISGMKPVNTTGGMMVNIDLSKDEKGDISIDKCDYDLVWVYKPKTNGKFSHFELIPVDESRFEEIKRQIGAEEFKVMELFSKNAKKAIESMWN